MQIKLRMFITSLFIIILTTGCDSYVANNAENEVKAPFMGFIKEINEGSAIVITSETENSKLEGPVEVELSVNPHEKFQIGDKVRIEYDKVMEVVPISNQSNAEVLDGHTPVSDNSNIDFSTSKISKPPESLEVKPVAPKDSHVNNGFKPTKEDVIDGVLKQELEYEIIPYDQYE